MIKRSAILLLIFAIGAFSLLAFASYYSDIPAPAKKAPVKCSGCCKKKMPVPTRWNIINPAIFQNEG